jgi:competence protein ComEA
MSKIPSERKTRPWLTRMDQAAVGAMTLVALAGMAVYWIAHGGGSGRLIEIDRAASHPAKFQLDINAAGWAELSVLPGVGETLARRIVDSRAETGPFADVEALRRVRGIGPRTLERIRPYLRPVPSAANVARE